MTDQQKAFIHAMEMAYHSQGAGQALFNSLVFGNLTKGQAREAIDYKIAQMKFNIESNPNLTREQKDKEISMRESWLNALIVSMGI